MQLTTRQLAAILEHCRLHPAATEEEIRAFCAVVRKYGFATAYVLPANLGVVREELQGCPTKIGTAIGFPFGTQTTRIKLLECEEAVQLGAEELDVVINIGALKSGNVRLVQNELRQLVEVVKPRPLKVILEVCYLTRQEISIGVQICCDVGAAYVKTATGFGARATSLEDVKVLVREAAGRIRVKVAGGVRDLRTLLKMYQIGADRFGVSSGDKLMEEFNLLYHGRWMSTEGCRRDEPDRVRV